MKKFLLSMALLCAMAMTAAAQQPCNNCGTAGGGGVSIPGSTGHPGLFGYGKHPNMTHDRAQWNHPIFSNPWFAKSQNVYRMPTLPVHMAAPWYLYFPYDGHFQTVAPMANAPFYPPPAYTGNPYLPAAYSGYMQGNPVPAGFPRR
ncbi:MAG: hypothetical protein R3B84_00050 [Zavarzinella sp.]